MSLFFFDTRSKMKDVLHVRNTSRQDVDVVGKEYKMVVTYGEYWDGI